MSADKIENLNSMQLDVLREIGNIGAGNAATALACLLADKVDMTVPVLEIVGMDEATASLGGPENPVVGILLAMSGDVSGIIMFVLQQKFIQMVFETLLNKKCVSCGDIKKLDEMDTSLLKELGNILAGAYLNAMSQLTGLRIDVSPPDISADMAGAIMSLPAAMFGLVGDKALLIREDFIKGDHITSHIIMVPELNSLNLILKRLGVM
jgi:chemotaxis protein CheC